MKAERESASQWLLPPNGSRSQTGNEARRILAWRVFTQQQRESCSWSSFNFLPKMVVIRTGFWADLSRISSVQLPETQIKPAAVYLMVSLLPGQTDGSEDRRDWNIQYGALHLEMMRVCNCAWRTGQLIAKGCFHCNSNLFCHLIIYWSFFSCCCYFGKKMQIMTDRKIIIIILMLFPVAKLQIRKSKFGVAWWPSQQEGPGFDSTCLSVCVWVWLGLSGFSPRTPASPHSPKTCR